MSSLPHLHVCLVTQQFGRVISGPGVHARLVTERLLADGHRVTIITPRAQIPSEFPGCTFIPVPDPFFAGSQARWVALALSFAKALRKLEESESPDLIHFTDAREAAFSQTHAPKVGNINDTYSAQPMPLEFYRQNFDDWRLRYYYYAFVHQSEKWVLPKLDAVIANSHFTAGVIGQQYPGTAGKVYMCYKSIPAAFFAPAIEKRRANPVPTAPVVLYVGTNMQRKGVPDLIRAAPQVIQTIPNVQFWLVGLDPAAPALEEFCTQKGVRGYFHFLGWKDRQELLDLYAQATAFAMPSLTEALGIALLEAMAAGVPVVSTQVGGIPEIIEDGVNGVLVPPQNPDALARALVGLLKDPARQEQFRQAGLQAVQRFSPEAMMDCTYEIYRKVLEKNREKPEQQVHRKP